MLLRRSIVLALALVPAPLLAQAVAPPLATSDADALAEQVRRLGANPQDVDALLTAAELSLRLDDLSAAGSFLARADKVSPGGARGQAVRGAILVRSERPGEALRAFDAAEAGGWPPARFAADRGLAFDLVGDPGRAQRDYKLALSGPGEDETRRRYALSLAIAGRGPQAQEVLAPLIKRNDRAAWRTRAFVLALGGDQAEASRIAATMMPPGSAQGLRGFFAELPGLSAVDKAFAVHFGEVRASPTRLADARFAPQQPPLPLEAAPVRVAAVAPPPPPEKGRKVKIKPGRVTVVEYVPLPRPVAAEPAQQPPAYQAPVYQPPVAVASTAADRPLSAGEQASLLAAQGRSSRRGSQSAVPAPPTPTPAPTLNAAEQASVAAASGARLPERRRVELAAVAPPRVPPVPAATPPRAADRPSAPVTNAPRTTPPVPSSEPRLPAVVVSRPLLTDGLGPSIAASATPAPPASTPSPAPTALASASPAAVVAPSTTGASVLPPQTSTPAAPFPITTVAPAPSTIAADQPPPASIIPQAKPAAVASPPAQQIAAVSPQPIAAAPIMAATSAPVPTVPAAPVVTRPATPPVRAGRGEADSILAKIVAGLSVPASELGVGAPSPKPAPLARPKAPKDTAASAKASGVEQDVAALSRKDREAAARTLQAGGKLTAEQGAALLGGADVAPASWTVSRGERHGLAAAVAAGRPLNRSQQRVVAASIAADAPARGSKRVAVAAKDEGQPAPLTRRERAALAAKVAAGEALGDDERTTLGLADVAAARTAPTRAERRALAAAIASGATLNRTQKRQLAALAFADEEPPSKGRRDGKADAASALKGKRDKADASDRRAAKAEPARIWVQVAGGANGDDLAKAWGAARAKAPAAFAGRKGYTTPLRATNRVLTGPFKTDAEARAYVNQLAKAGVSAFSFTSDAGQKVSKLGDK